MIELLSFADNRFSTSRIKKEAVLTGWFDNIICGGEELLESWYYSKYKKRFGDRGFGYWQWKSYLIRKELDKLSEGDILVWLDAVCTINMRGEKRFREYVQQVKDDPVGILVSECNHLEKRWTKGDLFVYYSITDRDDILNAKQKQSGIICILKSKKSCLIVDEWYYVSHEHYSLISDTPSRFPNDISFRENRHDQSLFSILCSMNNVITIPEHEVWTDGNWDELYEYPFWATRQRDLKKKSILNKLKNIIKE